MTAATPKVVAIFLEVVFMNRVGRFGWKSTTAVLMQSFIALRDVLFITKRLAYSKLVEFVMAEWGIKILMMREFAI